MIAHSWMRAAASHAAAAALAGAWMVGCMPGELPAASDCEEVDGSCRDNQGPRGCICPEIYAPVCGTDDQTYGNACEARCAEAPVAHEGECRPAPDPGEPCACPAVYDPVCGADGKTYGNACEARCAAVEVAHEGECGEDGCGSATCKSNADCPRGTICYPPSGQCQPQCAIACLVYDPVCGTDGVTYGCGEADAHCHGAEVAYPGECSSTCQSDAECPHGYCDRGVTCAAIGCPPPPPNRCTVCGDGSQLLCRALPAPCPDGLVREIVDSCYGECVDRFTCAAAAGTCRYEGQTYRPGETFPASDGCNTCSCSADGNVACTLKACVCDYSDPDRKWVARSREQCATVRFTCADGLRPFFDDCGCGCEPEATACSVGGCSGQLCVGPGDPGISTCEWRPEYACYRSADCEAQADGRCGWTQTDELRRCIEDARRGS